MKRLLMTLFIGLALVACSNTKTDTTDQNNANQNNTTQNQNNNDTTTDQTADADVKYLEDLGYKDVNVATGTNAHQTYKLNEATAVDQNIYGQWVFTWVEPAEYVEKDVNVQQYTATKHNKNYDVFVMTDANQNVIGGYYYEAGQTMNEAKILDEKHTPRIVKDFESTWNRLFNINQTNSTDTTDTQGQNR